MSFIKALGTVVALITGLCSCLGVLCWVGQVHSKFVNGRGGANQPPGSGVGTRPTNRFLWVSSFNDEKLN